jgi:hypothetical protein
LRCGPSGKIAGGKKKCRKEKTPHRSRPRKKAPSEHDRQSLICAYCGM